jgi:hypothetical protein
MGSIAEAKTFPLDSNHILLRGCAVRNTKHVVGMVRRLTFSEGETKACGFLLMFLTI